MNIQKYLLPASMAATVHVALLWFLPEETYVPRPIEVLLAGPKPPPPDRPVISPDPETKPQDFEKAVRPLAGGPTPPEISETLMPLTKDAITIPMDERPKFDSKDLKLVPKTFGPGDLPAVGDVDMPDIFSIKSLDRTPRAKAQMPPDYPYAMKQSGTSGSVLVEFDVDTSGRVTRAEALNYTDRAFVEPALRAVRGWHFEPGRRNDKAVPFRMSIPIEFNIETGT
jgi:protein TonB